jgi:hypothetical protein
MARLPAADAPSRILSLGLGSTPPSTRRTFNYNRPTAALATAPWMLTVVAGLRRITVWLGNDVQLAHVQAAQIC